MQNPEPTAVDPKDAALCDTEINELHRDINQQQLEIDKQLLTISSGLIVLSLAFVKDAKTTPLLVTFLVLGLALIFACIGCVLFSFRLSIAGQEKVKLYWESRRGDTYGKHKYPTQHALWVKRINACSYILFALGFLCIVIFVTVNILEETRMPKKEDNTTRETKIGSQKILAKDGAILKTPPPPPPPPTKPE